MSETPAPLTWLTPEAHERPSTELAQLSGPGRIEIAKKIEAAREEGDLKENGGYHAAKEEQGKREARIRQIQQLLDNSTVGKPAALDDGRVSVGMVVTVDLAGDEMTFLLGSREVAGETDLDVYSERSPLGEAINGHAVGEEVTYVAPNGKAFPVTIKSASPFTG